MPPRFLFARRFDDSAAQVAAGARRSSGPAASGAAVPFSFPRLEPASAIPPLPAPEAPAPTFSAPELASAVEAARREAYAEAASELQAELTASREQREADALAALSHAFAASRDALERVVATRASASRDLALAVARALVARALAAQPLADVEAMFRELVVRLEGQPWLEVRLPPEVAPAGEAALTRIAAEVGFQGDLRVLADRGLGAGDARLAWHEGMAERDLARIEAEAMALVDAWLPAVSGALSGEPEAVAPDEAGEDGSEA
jgi:flagellar biosynthesis/type III secretory pathway protein FliH